MAKSKYVIVYEKMLAKERELREQLEADLRAIAKDKEKVEKAILKLKETAEVPEIICEEEPYIAWQMGVKNNAFAIKLYRIIRDKVTKFNRTAKDHEALQNTYKENIGNWLLQSLNKAGEKSVNCGDAGKAYKKRKVRAKAEDWAKMLSWAVDHEAEDIVEKRVNAGFVTKYEEEHGELPPFVSVFKEDQIVVTK